VGYVAFFSVFSVFAVFTASLAMNTAAATADDLVVFLTNKITRPGFFNNNYQCIAK